MKDTTFSVAMIVLLGTGTVLQRFIMFVVCFVSCALFSCVCCISYFCVGLCIFVCMFNQALKTLNRQSGMR